MGGCRMPDDARCSGGIRIAIADDHPLMRDALASAIGSAVPGAQFVEAACLETTLALVAQTPGPDLLLMDLHMPGADGLSGVRAVRARAPQVPLAVVSADEEAQIERATKRDGFDEAATRARIRAQMPLAEKRALADYVIENDGSLGELRDKTDRVLDAILASHGIPKERYPRPSGG